MIIEYDVVCFERTLTIKLSDKYEHLKEAILKSLDEYYDEWHNSDEDTCLEAYMMDKLFDNYNITLEEEWEAIPYGEDYEPREHLWVCDHCNLAIWSREGDIPTLRHYVDETDAVESKCDWCKQVGFDTLYELV